MNAALWRLLEAKIEEYDFHVLKREGARSPVAWFCAKDAVDPALSTWLRVEFKPKLRVLTAYLGRTHTPTRAFCIDALKNGWPKGHEWLVEVGVVDAPCMSMFNLAEWMKWPLAGIPISPEVVYGSALGRFGEECLTQNVRSQGAKGLLEDLLQDNAPFGWRNCNAAIRLAEIAGLIKFLQLDVSCFDQVSEKYSELIQTSMFSLGRAEEWIGYLRAKI